MDTFFSATSRGFYSDALRVDYDLAGAWPSDAIKVDPETEAALRAALATGATIEHAGQEWRVTPTLQIPFSVLAVPQMEAFRQNREIALNRLSGLGFTALLAGDAEHAQEVAAVRSNLLSVPEVPAVRDAEDLDALGAALAAAWAGAYAGTTAPEIATAMAVGAGGGQTRPPPP